LIHSATCPEIYNGAACENLTLYIKELIATIIDGGVTRINLNSKSLFEIGAYIKAGETSSSSWIVINGLVPEKRNHVGLTVKIALKA
jgi:hypothetical protein